MPSETANYIPHGLSEHRNGGYEYNRLTPEERRKKAAEIVARLEKLTKVTNSHLKGGAMFWIDCLSQPLPDTFDDRHLGAIMLGCTLPRTPVKESLVSKYDWWRMIAAYARGQLTIEDSEPDWWPSQPVLQHPGYELSYKKGPTP